MNQNIVEKIAQKLIDLNNDGKDWDKKHILGLLATLEAKIREDERKKIFTDIYEETVNAASPLGILKDGWTVEKHIWLKTIIVPLLIARLKELYQEKE